MPGIRRHRSLGCGKDCGRGGHQRHVMGRVLRRRLGYRDEHGTGDRRTGRKSVRESVRSSGPVAFEAAERGNRVGIRTDGEDWRPTLSVNPMVNSSHSTVVD